MSLSDSGQSTVSVEELSAVAVAADAIEAAQRALWAAKADLSVTLIGEPRNLPVSVIRSDGANGVGRLDGVLGKECP